jgi:hypothetical protein
MRILEVVLRSPEHRRELIAAVGSGAVDVPPMRRDDLLDVPGAAPHDEQDDDRAGHANRLSCAIQRIRAACSPDAWSPMRPHIHRNPSHAIASTSRRRLT